jgi:hypothetical protein
MSGSSKLRRQVAARSMRQSLLAVRDRIDEFESEELLVKQYTDTGEMWELLHLLREIAEMHVGRNADLDRSSQC